mmetsp:Transcript_14828/g.45286  ORF Transcript_14828/g.45286 Transcript_14828/m.45286 type:complete len:87 (-) Transcript_14828:1852-2112(-)
MNSSIRSRYLHLLLKMRVRGLRFHWSYSGIVRRIDEQGHCASTYNYGCDDDPISQVISMQGMRGLCSQRRIQSPSFDGLARPGDAQ